MIGQYLQERRKTPLGAIVCFLLAALLIGLSLTIHEREWAILSLLPALCGAALLIGRPAPFQAELTSTELVILPSGEGIPYRDVIRVSFIPARGSRDSGMILLFHPNGTVRIPESVGVSGVELYTFLSNLTQQSTIQVIHPSIRPFCQDQFTTFGSDRVWTHTARLLPSEYRPNSSRYLWFGVLLTGLSWIAIAFPMREQGWMIAGVCLAFFSPLVAIISRSFRSTRVDGRLSDSSLVVSPVGIALAQGDLIGQMRWSELRDVRDRPGIFNRAAISLHVEGATVDILDIYDTPLVEIRRQIEHYWNAG